MSSIPRAQLFRHPKAVYVPGFCARHGADVFEAEEKFAHPDAVINNIMLRLVNQRFPRPGVPPCCQNGDRAFRSALAAALAEARTVRLDLRETVV